MKNIILLFIVLLITASSFSQQKNTNPELTKQGYPGKGKRQRITSAILLGGGFFCVTMGGKMGGKCASGFSNVAGGVLMISGLAAMVTSVPLFSISFVNKGKGKSLSFNNQTIPQNASGSFSLKAIPALKIKINL